MGYNYCPLIKAIDAFLEKADDKLKDVLETAGFVDAEDTVERISKLEENVARMLKDETKYVTDKVGAASDLDEFSKN